METRLIEMEDPTFEPGSAHSAIAPLTNPTEDDFSYTTELYLGLPKAATSGVSAPFTIPAGGTVDITYNITMPATPGEYEVFIDVWSGGVIIGHFKATENVIIEEIVLPEIEIGPIIWS